MSSSQIAAAIRRARAKTNTDPTEAQQHAGNYAKGECTIHGLRIKIENPRGTTRRGKSKDGTKWERLMTADYGYFAGTEAFDGDAVDCFIGPDPENEFVVAIDQYWENGEFDETKFILGVSSQEEGEKLYLSHYQKGWKLGPVSTTTVGQLREWLKNGDTKSAFKGQMVKAAEQRYPTYDDVRISHEKVMPDGRVIDVVKLNEIVAKLRPLMEKKLSEMKRPSASPRSGFSYNRLAAVDPEKPVVAGPGGQLLDGRHRTLKRMLRGDETIQIREATDEDVAASEIQKAAATVEKPEGAFSTERSDHRLFQEDELRERARRAPINYTKRLRALYERRGECPECRKPNQPGNHQCKCGTVDANSRLFTEDTVPDRPSDGIRKEAGVGDGIFRRPENDGVVLEHGDIKIYAGQNDRECAHTCIWAELGDRRVWFVPLYEGGADSDRPEKERDELWDRGSKFPQYWLDHALSKADDDPSDSRIMDELAHAVSESGLMADLVADSGEDEIEKSAVVKEVDGKWLLYTKDGSRVLGTHNTAQEAYGQEYAIQKSQEQRTGEPVVKELKQAKLFSDRKKYSQKHAILQRLLREHSPDFFEDSRKGGIIGITHAPSNFRIHIPADKLQSPLRKAAAAMEQDSNLDGALLGALATGGLPLASQLQYAGYDLPRQLRQARELSRSLPTVKHDAPNVSDYARQGRVILQGTEATPLRDIFKDYLGRRGAIAKGTPLRERFQQELDHFRKAWDDKFELGYGATATSGSPFRHAAMMDSKGQVLDAHPDRTGRNGAQIDEHNAAAARRMQSPQARGHYSGLKGPVAGATWWTQSWGKPQAFSLLGDFDTPDRSATMASAYTNSASHYNKGQAKQVGIRHLLAPRLPLGSRRGKIVCRDGYCSRQAEDAFGLVNALGGKDHMPSHLAMRKDFKPVALVTEGIKGNAAQRAKAVEQLWTKGIKTNARRRLGLGALTTAATALPGLLAGLAADKASGRIPAEIRDATLPRGVA